MKTTRFNVLTAAILMMATVFIFNACKKDDKDEAELKCLISTLDISWSEVCDDETYSGSGLINLSYDSDGRLTSWTWDDGEQLLFFYGSDGKIQRVEEHYNGSVYELRFTWEGNKVTIQNYYPGGIESNFKKIAEFNNQDEVIRVEGFYKFDGVWEKEWYDQYTWQNGNLMKLEEFYLDGWKKNQQLENNDRPGRSLTNRHRAERNRTKSSVTTKSSADEFVLGYTSTFTYDNKRNPFSIHRALVVVDFDPLFLSRNNMVTWTEIEFYDGEQWEWTQNLSWQYNNQDFPTQMIISEEEDDCQYTSTILFNYSNCD